VIAESALSLEARLAIQDLIFTYAAAMDSSDWDQYRSCFRPDARTKMDRVGEFETCEAVIGLYVERFKIFAVLQHFVSNVHVRGSGDQATARTNFVSHHVPIDGAPYTYGGTFEFDVVRDAAGWRFSSHAIRVLWEAGSPIPVDGG
jgi:3-phenylpropionate/cinnamic acid dioxygenase small subunit